MKMGNKSKLFTMILASTGMLVLILDSELVLQSAADGIMLCLRSLIPAIFPFLVVSGILTGNIRISGNQKSGFLAKIIGIPAGTEPLLLLGFLGGYPSGAQNIYSLYARKALNREDAERMLPICNQAGPAFIFGVLPCLFTSKWIPFILWTVQIISALITAFIISKNGVYIAQHHIKSKYNVVDSLRSAVRTMGWICGWVVLFKVIIDFMEKRAFAVFPVFVRVLFAGLLELSNGLFGLNAVSQEFLRFLLTSAFLSFGGLCIFLQTKSVTGELDLKMYIIGKAIQVVISTLLSMVIYPVIYSQKRINMIYLLSIVVVMISFIAVMKKTVAISKKVLYNDKKSESEVLI